MPDRIPADHDAIESYRVHLETVGGTNRLQLPIPRSVESQSGDTCYLSLSGRPTYALIDDALTGEPVIRGSYSNRRIARERDGENLFRTWLGDRNLSSGNPVVFDVLSNGFSYGVRVPGEQVIYEPPRDRNTSLADIAKSLEE